MVLLYTHLILARPSGFCDTMVKPMNTIKPLSIFHTEDLPDHITVVTIVMMLNTHVATNDIVVAKEVEITAWPVHVA